MRRPYKSTAARRHQRETLQGWAIIIACGLAFAGMLAGAYHADKARGVTAGQSLSSWGL